jgi:hypothetical protein
MLRSPLCAAALASLTCSHVLAQNADRLVGITRIAADLRSVVHGPGNCAQLGTCAPVGFPSAVGLPEGAGGTAWDPTTSGAWITNGTVLAKVADDCTYQCPPTPVILPTNGVLTGLEVVESLRELWAIDDQGLLHRYTLQCPPQHVGACQTGLVATTPRTSTSGLAVDEGNGLVFFSFADFATNTTVIAVSRLANPCQIVQRLPVQPCPTSTTLFGAVTGLSVDWGQQLLFATDGHTTMAIHYGLTAIGIAVLGVDCCPTAIGNADPMIGLAVRPRRAVSFGSSCENGVCPPCPFVHQIDNDPNVGNLDFRLSVVEAPVGSLAWDLIGVGECGPPGRLVPPLCGPIWTGHLLGVLGPVPTGGVVGGNVCDGAARFSLPIPVLPGLVGSTLSSQSIVLCASLTGAIGTAVSNCVSFELQGN